MSTVRCSLFGLLDEAYNGVPAVTFSDRFESGELQVGLVLEDGRITAVESYVES